MLKKALFGVVIVMLLVLPNVAQAEPTCSATDTWEVPEEGAVAMFRKGERAFAVGAASGGAQVDGAEELYPRPIGCIPFENARCAMNVETCSGSCVAYLNYLCDPCDCRQFRFC